MPRINSAIRVFASLRLAICLIVVLLTVFAVATGLEMKHGREYSRWFIYDSGWFAGLLGLLGVSVFSAAYVRFPWKRKQTGFVITHAGLLAFLAGSLLTLWLGVEGEIVLVEGASTDQFTLNCRSQIAAYWGERPRDLPYLFTFESGPVDWPSGTNLDIGTVDGMSARVLRYYHQSQSVEKWVVDQSGLGGPLVRFQIAGRDGGGRIEHFLADQDYGAEVLVGPLAIRLQRAISEAMLADFLNPPASRLGKKGELAIYYQDHVERVPVDQHVGHPIEIGDSGAKVELVQYLGNAKLDAAGQFQPVGQDERNPLVELKVTLPEEDEPYRQVAFAKSPLLNFDGVYERTCPVKFAYQHPQFEAASAVELLQSADGKLYCRTLSDGACKSHDEVRAGSRIDLPGGFTLTLIEYLPHVRRDIAFESAKRRASNEASTLLPAAQVELTVAGATQTVWLQRNHPQYQRGTIDTPNGSLHVQFGMAPIPLGFSLELLDFQRERHRGEKSGACSSMVRLRDEEKPLDGTRTISTHQPLAYDGFRIYQTGFRDAGHGKEASVLSVSYDPGRALKHAGSLLVLLGITTMVSMRAYSSRGSAELAVDRFSDRDAAA
jgi:hypothetical protein